jgi:PAP2 superfamily
MPRFGQGLRRTLLAPARLELELLLIAALMFAWQAVRIPLEGTSTQAVEHARTLLSVERALHIDVESSFIEATRNGVLHEALPWLYLNIHLPILFGFLVVARLAAPARYPLLRLALFLSFIPSVFLIGLIPMAPPRWMPELGSTGAPSDAGLSATTGELLKNSTAAVSSQHFGYAFLIAAASLWLWPRRRLALLALLYPALVFTVILGTANHYVLDCLVGALTLGFGAAATALVARGQPRSHAQPAPAATVARLSIATVLLVWSAPGLITISDSFDAKVLPALVVGLVLATWPALTRAFRPSQDGQQALEAAKRA